MQVAFRDGAALRVGREQTLAELNLSNEAALALVSARWDSHPDCRDGQVADAAACLAKIRDDLLIAPQAQAEDPQLTLVYSGDQASLTGTRLSSQRKSSTISPAMAM